MVEHGGVGWIANQVKSQGFCGRSPGVGELKQISCSVTGLQGSLALVSVVSTVILKIIDFTIQMSWILTRLNEYSLKFICTIVIPDYHPDLGIQCLPLHVSSRNVVHHWRGIRFEQASFERTLTQSNTLYVRKSFSELANVEIRCLLDTWFGLWLLHCQTRSTNNCFVKFTGMLV